VGLNQALFLRPLAGQFARPADRFRFFTSATLGRLFKILAHFHFAENALSLQLFLQRAQGLIDIIVAYIDLYQGSSPQLFLANLGIKLPFSAKNCKTETVFDTSIMSFQHSRQHKSVSAAGRSSCFSIPQL
jgi:hypothetical protein